MKPEPQIDCAWVEDRIESHVDRELTNEEEKLLEEHLGVCPKCANEMDLAERVRASLRSEPPVVCPDPVIDRILADVSRIQPRKSLTPHGSAEGFRHSSWKWLAAALPACVLALGILTWSPPRETPIEITVAEPGYTDAEIREAERQMRVTLAYVGKVGLKGVALASREVIEEGILSPAEKTLVAMLETNALQFGREGGTETSR